MSKICFLTISKLGKNQQAILYEAARRWLLFGKPEGKTLHTAWTGLGPHTTYRTVLDGGYMQYACSVPRNPGHDAWYSLTPKGVEIVEEVIANLSLEEISKRAGW